MFIIPFLHNVIKQNDIFIHTIKILTIGGKAFWEENNSLDIDKDILNANDIYRKGRVCKLNKNVSLCEVDVSRTNVDEFYKWEEIDFEDKETFCWRTFIQIVDKNNHNWLNIPDDIQFGAQSLKDAISLIIQKKSSKP